MALCQPQKQMSLKDFGIQLDFAKNASHIIILIQFFQFFFGIIIKLNNFKQNISINPCIDALIAIVGLV